MKITIVPPDGPGEHPLLFQWQADALPLPAYMALNPENGVVTFENSDRNGEPFTVIQGLWFWWRIDPGVTRTQAAEIAEDLIPQFVRVCSGYVVERDGRYCKGVLNEDAKFARINIRERLWETFGLGYVARTSSFAER